MYEPINKKSRIQEDPGVTLQEKRKIKHDHLVNMINNYRRTSQEEARLFRIRNNTILEIDMRFRNCSNTLNYEFPRNNQQHIGTQQQEQQQQLDMEVLQGPTYYDLYSQNQIHKSKLSLGSPGKRIKSLDQRNPHSPSASKIMRVRQKKFENQLALKSHQKIIRSKTQPKNLQLSPLILPSINKRPEYLKTQITTKRDMVKEIINKKLPTQQRDHSKKYFKKIHRDK